MIDNVSLRIDFLDGRNRLSHMYSGSTADDIFSLIQKEYQQFTLLADALVSYHQKNAVVS